MIKTLRNMCDPQRGQQKLGTSELPNEKKKYKRTYCSIRHSPVWRKQERAHQKKSDDDDIFAQYIATELRSIEDTHVKRTVKWKIQSLIFSAHSSTTPHVPQHEVYSAGQPWDYLRQGYPPLGPYRQGHSPATSSVPSPHFPNSGPMQDYNPEID